MRIISDFRFHLFFFSSDTIKESRFRPHDVFDDLIHWRLCNSSAKMRFSKKKKVVKMFKTCFALDDAFNMDQNMFGFNPVWVQKDKSEGGFLNKAVQKK